MKYAFKNLVTFFKTERMIFLLIILCVFSSVMVLHFSYGLYQNFHVIRTEAESDLKEIEIEIIDPERVTKAELECCLLSLSENFNDAVKMYIVEPVIEPFHNKADYWGSLCVRFTIQNHTISPCAVFQENLTKFGTLVEGEYFTPEQEASGARVVIVGNDMGDYDSCTDSITLRNDESGFWVSIQDKKYEVIGVQQMTCTPLIPFASLDGDTPLEKTVDISFYRSMTRSQYEELSLAFMEQFQDAVVVPSLDIPESENLYLYNTILIISVAISILAAANFAVLYQYMLEKRRREIAIFQICGCPKFRAFRIFLTECLLIMLPVYLIAAVTFAKLLLPQFRDVFPYMEPSYNANIYAAIFSIYCVTSLVILFALIANQIKGKTLAESKGRYVS